MKFNKYNKICFLDTETTSVYWNSAAPIQIAALICDADGNVIDTFNERIRTTHAIHPEAYEVHGISKEDLRFCRCEYDVLEDFCLWMQNHQADVVVTYNGEAFDRPMLNCRCKTLFIPFNYFSKEEFPGIDARQTVFEAKKRNLYDLKSLGRKWKLTLVSEKMGIDTSNAHDALGDVFMLKEVFFALDPKIHPENWGLGAATVSLF